MRTWLAAALALGALGALGSPAAAMEPAPLPAFEVQTLEGQAIASSELGRTGRWLLVYVAAQSQPSKLLLNLIKKEQDADTAAGVVVVVGGSAAETRAVCDAFPGLARAAWYADPDRAAFTALAIKGAPTAVGLRDRSMQWKMDGVPVDPRTVKSILLSWVTE